jgi:signal transduction histidine kinase
MLQEARPQRLSDITKDPRFVGDWPPAHPALKDFLGMPVMDDEDILGAIYLANKRGGAGFTDADERMLSVLAAHAAIALTNARLYEQSRELTIVQERQRIARELHDAVAQKLFSLRLTADAAATLAEVDPAKAAAELATVRRLAAEAADELRQVVIELRPADLAGDGLPAVLGKQVDVLNRVGGTTVTLVVEGWRRLPIAKEEAVLRVAQEALHNAMRHAEASSITVRLAAADGRAELVVTDNGVGFDVSAATRGAHRLGLASMRERARAAGGRLSVRSRPRSGTTVTLEVPLR